MTGSSTTHHSVTGWMAGWTISAPPDRLFRATINHLDLDLSSQPLVLDVQFAGMSLALNIPAVSSMECRLSAHGLRIQSDEQHQHAIISIFKSDPGTLLIESDESLLPWPHSKSMNDADGEAVSVLSEGQHHLAVVSQHRTSPARMVILSGTGQSEQLIARGRTNLGLSAHQLLDSALRKVDVKPGEIPPAEYLKSRLRPATPVIPYPWIAGEDQEPAWDIAQLYIICQGIVFHEPGIAAGLINNLIELSSDTGQLPISGGNLSQLSHREPSWPLLVRMFWMYRRVMTSWPADLDASIEKLSRYLLQSVDRSADHSAPPEQAYLYEALLDSEFLLWEKVQQQTTGSKEEALKKIRGGIKIRPAVQLNDAIPVELRPWLDLVRRNRSPTAGPASTAGSIPAFNQYLRDSLMNDGAFPLLLSIAITEYMQETDHPELDTWIRELQQTAQAWQTNHSTLSTGVERVTIAGFNTWISSQQRVAQQSTRDAHSRSIVWINRKRKWITGGMMAVLLVGVIWLISIQMRSSMPTSVYEAHMGVVLQHYQAGKYETALEQIAALEERGAGGNVGLQFMKGKVFFNLKEYARAIECFEYAASQRPNHASPQFNIGVCHFNMKNYRQAADIFDDCSSRFARSQPDFAARSAKAAELSRRFDRIRLSVAAER